RLEWLEALLAAGPRGVKPGRAHPPGPLGAGGTPARGPVPPPRPIAPGPSLLVVWRVTASTRAPGNAPAPARPGRLGRGGAGGPRGRGGGGVGGGDALPPGGPPRRASEGAARGAPPARIRRREVHAEVACAERAEQRARDGVEQHISVRVTHEAAVVRDG